MFYLDTGKKSNCCGCKACEQICPTNCLEMEADNEGFYYPVKNQELCNHCDLCKTVCPNVNKDKILINYENFQSKAFMAIHKDESILNKSASGGGFSAIVKSFCKDNFVVFGVEFDNEMNVIHSYTEAIQETAKYRKSKYVQSDINESYKRVEEFLKEGKNVLFSGTPCQVSGLKLYLKKDYHNLFCLDLVCHGVPSQKVFNDYMGYLQKKYRGKITSVSFRYKTHTNGKHWNSKNIKAIINYRTIINSAEQDLYLRGFHGELFFRPSCYECKYADPKRVSDITMADFWGVEKLYPNENVHKGVSVLLTNTIKGYLLLQNMNEYMRLLEVDKKFVIESNAQLNHPAKLHPKRDMFYELLKTKTFNQAVEKCIPQPSFVKIIVTKMLPESIKEFIKRTLC